MPAMKPTAPVSSALDRHGIEPLYRQLAAALLRGIDAGQWQPGERMPGETDCMARYAVSRITVRQAIALLVSSGKVVTQRGKGTFVAGRVLRHDLDALQGFHAALRSQGLEPQTRLLEWSTQAGALDPARPSGLDLPVRLQRLYSLDERAFALVVGYLPKAAAALGKARAARLSVYEILADFMGLRVTSADVTIRCEQAPREVTQLLGLKRSDRVLVMQRQSHTANGQVCEFMRIYITPERYEFRLRVSGQFEIARAVHRVAAQPANRRGAPA